MDAVQLAAITDVDVLRSMVADKLRELAERDATLASRDRTILYKDARIQALTAEIKRLQRVQFAARTEKMDPDQRALFDETLSADIAAVEAELDALRSPEATAQAATTRAKPKRRPLPPELPRVETRHEPASCSCAQCGADLVQIGEHVSEKLDCKPLEFFVRRAVYPQYACRGCQTITAAPVAPAIIDRGIAAPGLIAQVAISKYVDHLPLYRQEAIYARSGVELGRTSMAEWLGAAGVALQPLVAALRAELLTHRVLHADETPVAMLDPGAGKTKRAYLFAYRTAADHPIVVFDFCTSRSGRHAKSFLGDYRGALMVDDYSGYKALFAQGVTELGCWAHARRKFVDLHKASGSQIAQQAIGRIAALYQIEAKARDLDDTARHRFRHAHAAPLVHELKSWFDTIRPTVAGNSGTANAIDYSLKRGRPWPATSPTAAIRSTTIRSRMPSGPSPWAGKTGCSPVPNRQASAPPRS